MDQSNNGNKEQGRRNMKIGVIALAAVSLLAGSSVAAILEDYAAPEYAEGDPYEGAVDDMIGEDTWEAKETSDKPLGKHIRKAMKSRMDDRMEDRIEHLEMRVEVNSNLILAFQFCLESANCTADAESLSGMVDKLTKAVDGMQAKIDGTESAIDAEENDNYDSEKICLNEKNGIVYFDCDEEKYSDWDERKHWDETERVKFAIEKFTQLRSANEAVIFCIESEDCMADSDTIENVLQRMISRAEHHIQCADERRCNRDHDMRKGFRGRMGGAICKVVDRCEHDRTELSQEICESKMGIWTEATDRGNGVFYCDWSQLGEESVREDGNEEDERSEEEGSSENQEECESNGGTWYEERQHCHSE